MLIKRKLNTEGQKGKKWNLSNNRRNLLCCKVQVYLQKWFCLCVHFVPNVRLAIRLQMCHCHFSAQKL